MSGLILCGRPLSAKPYYIPEAGLHIYSEQELCYYIYNNLMMIDDSFISDGLIRFLEEDLSMEELGQRLRKRKGKTATSQLLLLIMQSVDYYGREELEQFRRQLEEKEQARPYDLLKSRADYMLKQKRYPKAVELYDHALGKEQEWEVPEEVMGGLWHNKALAQAGMFWMQEAADSLIRAFVILQDSEILKELFYLRLLEPGLTIPEEISMRIPAQQQYRWREEYELYDRQAANAPQVRRMDRKTEQAHEWKRDETDRILTGWKQEYREMVM